MIPEFILLCLLHLDVWSDYLGPFVNLLDGVCGSIIRLTRVASALLNLNESLVVLDC